MGRVLLQFTSAARDDLEALGEVLEERVGLGFAQRRVKALMGHAKRLLDHPELGRAVQVSGVSGRRLVCGDHIVYYELEEKPLGVVVTILRFWAAHRDPVTLDLSGDGS